MRDPKTFSAEQLLAHLDWVRRLAATLVAKPADAEDVAQETWRVALERPPRHASNARHWLAVVARNVARRFGSAQRRLAERKQHLSAPDSAPSAAEIVERAQLQRRLVDAVLALDEPYRSTLLFRFFEGLETREIATRAGVPLETARTWLKRGLARLREVLQGELGDRAGGWRAVLAPIALPQRAGEIASAATPATVLVTGVLAMTKSKVVVVGVLALAMLATWRIVASDAARGSITTTISEQNVDVASNEAAAAATLAATRVELPEPRDRESESANPSSPGSLPSPAFVGVVRTAGGEPVPDATILLGRTVDRGFESREALLTSFAVLAAQAGEEERAPKRTTSDEAGCFEIDAEGPHLLAVAAVRTDLGIAWQTGLRVDESRRPTQLELVLEQGPRIAGRIFGPDGAPRPRAHVEIHVFDASRRRARGHGRSLGAVTADEHGEYRTIALPYPAFEIVAETWEPVRMRTAAPSSSGVVEVGVHERERRIDVTLDAVETVTGHLRVVGDGRLAEAVRTSLTKSELEGSAAGALGVFATSADPVRWFHCLHMLHPRSGIGTTYMTGEQKLSSITWVSGTIDLEQSTYSIRLVEPGMTYVAAIARKQLLGWAEIPASREGPELVLDLGQLPDPLGRGTIAVAVVDGDSGQPIGTGRVHAEVVARDGDITTSSGDAFAVRSDGTATVEVRDGEIWLVGDVPGFCSTGELVQLRTGERASCTLVVGRSMRRLTGRILALPGHALHAPEVRIYRRIDGRWAALAVECDVDAAGAFEARGLPESELLLVARSTELAPEHATIAATGDATVDFTLHPAHAVTLRQIARDGRPLGGIRHRIFDQAAVPLVDGFAGGSTTFFDSAASTVRLRDGLYELEAWAPDYEVSRTRLRVEGEESVELGMWPVQH